MVSGRPISVLKLPGVRSTSPELCPPERARSSAAATSSLVVVLPFDPVMPTTCPRNFARTARARSASARRGSSTAMTGHVAATRRGCPARAATTTAATPGGRGRAQKSNPSTRSPGSAKNSRPGAPRGCRWPRPAKLDTRQRRGTTATRAAPAPPAPCQRITLDRHAPATGAAGWLNGRPPARLAGRRARAAKPQPRLLAIVEGMSCSVPMIW